MSARPFPRLGNDPRRWLAVGTVAFLPPAGWLAVHRPGLLAALMLGIPVGVLLVRGLSLSLDRALLGYLPVYVAADTLKRLVFVVGPDTAYVQYIPLAIKFALLVLLGAWGLGRRLSHRRFDTIDRVLLIYLVCVVVGVLTSGALTLVGKLMLLPFAVGPFLIFYAYREAARTPGFTERFLRWMVVLGFASAIYGLFQSQVGPSWVDRAWAEASHGFSIQAKNVWLAMTEGTPMRPYGFFADHFTFGYFLAAALFAVAFTRWPRSRVPRLVVIGVLGLALVAAMTRAAWCSIGFAVMVGAALRIFPGTRRLAPAAVLVLYAGLSLAVSPIYDRFFPVQSFESVAMRQAFSLGSLSARVNAGEAMGEAVQRYPLIGDAGEASGVRFITAKLSGDLAEVGDEEIIDDAHNFLVGQVVSAGVPGLIAMIAFLSLTLAAAARRRSVAPVAVAGGLVLAGVAGGATILAGFLIAWCALALRDDENEIATGGAHA